MLIIYRLFYEKFQHYRLHKYLISTHLFNSPAPTLIIFFLLLHSSFFFHICRCVSMHLFWLLTLYLPMWPHTYTFRPFLYTYQQQQLWIHCWTKVFPNLFNEELHYCLIIKSTHFISSSTYLAFSYALCYPLGKNQVNQPFAPSLILTSCYVFLSTCIFAS